MKFLTLLTQEIVCHNYAGPVFEPTDLYILELV